MSPEKPEYTDEKHGRAILIATLLTAFMTPEQRAAFTAKYPKEMGEIAGLIAQVLPPDQLKELALTGTKTEATEPPTSTPETGSRRFGIFRRFAAKVPLIRRLL